MQREYSERFFDYCLGMAQEFNGRLDRIRAFAKHNLSSGNANELILRDFLSLHAPKDYCVGQGFICDPTATNAVSRQCDILIYNQAQFPLVYEDGSIKIVWPDAARMVIEVKTSLNSKAPIEKAVKNIAAARSVSITTNGAIFAFKSESKIETVLSHLQKEMSEVNENHLPVAIMLFEKGVIIQRTGNAQIYNVWQSKREDQRQAVVIAYLLQLFFESVWFPGGSQGAPPYEVKRSLLGNYTENIHQLNCSSLR